MMTFLFAGHDTTINLLTWALYYISINQDVQEKLLLELKELPDDLKTITFDEIDNLSYLSKIIKETLRLRPSAPGLARNTVNEAKLGDITLCKGVGVIYCPYATHRNPLLWESPEDFIPERFNKNPEPYTYIPFGEGPRKCIGERLALLESKIALVYLLKYYNFKLSNENIIDDETQTTLRARYGINMIISSK